MASKTPEELYFERMMQEYTTRWEGCPYLLGSIKGITALSLANCEGYEAGYSAAWDEWRAGKLFQNQDHADAVYKEAAKDQLADAGKVMPQWISVKERLPEIPDTRSMSEDVLWLTRYGEMEVSCLERLRSEFRVDWGEAGLLKLDQFTHWMPLPKPLEDV